MQYLDINVTGAIVEVFEMNDYYYIDAIIIDKEMRGQGLGSTVMKQIKELASKTGKYILCWATDLLGGDLHKLHKWYRSLGFINECGVVDGEFDYNFKYIN